MPFHTELCEMLGIEHPVVMGGLTGVGTPELAAAVSNAGGCGFVCAHQSGDPERCVEWLKQMDELTDKPWGVNLTILREFTQAEGYCNAIIDAQCHIIETAGRNPVRACSTCSARVCTTAARARRLLYRSRRRRRRRRRRDDCTGVRGRRSSSRVSRRASPAASSSTSARQSATR
jgi:NAD(P)H-dependent flavin oxidoreductase YrpB (nitropropane dioxygenase family)